MKIGFILILLFFTVHTSFAQYSKYSAKYDHKQYEFIPGDKYSPTTAGILAIFPGAGHFYTGQIFRGLLFPVGMLTSAIIASNASWSTYMNDSSVGLANTGVILGVLGFAGIYTLNFFDAVKVAKIKNLHFRERDISFHISPCIYQQRNDEFVGFSLKMSF